MASSVPSLSAPSVPVPLGDIDPRHAARRRIYELIRDCQSEEGIPAGAVSDFIERGERQGWADVVKLGVYLGYVNARYHDQAHAADWSRRLLECAQRDKDQVMTALALAARAQTLDLEPGRAGVDADRDLARAIVLLEGWSGPATEAVSAHIECARACEQRDLWELQLHHYEAAEQCLDWSECGADRLAVLLYNRAEVEVNWVAALREHGSVAGLAERAERARDSLRAADVAAMPDSWHEDLVIFRELVDAISPPEGFTACPDGYEDAAYASYMHLARAFAAAPGPQARAHVDRALETIDQEASTRIYLLALALAVELEASDAGHATAGLRWGRELVARKWERRLAALASMQSLVEVERLSAEHALLQQHALLDDLTGLANRRALARFTEGLRGQGVRAVAVALVDLDHFKAVNDTHGHAVGDEALSALAGVLREGVREQDLVVRLGGDEFLLMLPLHDPVSAQRRCEAIVERISEVPWEDIASGLRVTASLGIAFGSLEDFDLLYGDADAALYRAKQAGGGCVAL